jgi:hypothetical protein
MGISSMGKTLAGLLTLLALLAHFFKRPARIPPDGMPSIVNGQQSLSEHHLLLHI